MVDWDKKFKPEYDATKTAISKNNNYERDWRPLVRKLEELMGVAGFDGAKAVALNDLRDKIKGRSNARITEDEGILRAVDAWTATDAGTINARAKERAAALKLLRHVYLQNKYGNKRVWVVNLPKDFTDWPSRYLATNAGGTADQVKQLLASSNEHFTDQQRRHLGSSTQHAMAWCQKAGIVLAEAAATGAGAGTPAAAACDQARAKVKRWFAEPGLPDATLNIYIATLAQGFKKIIAMFTKGNFTVTDWVPFRGAKNADERDFLASEAFTFAANGEGMDVVYIESAFFRRGNNVLNGQANWTRIIVHELTHLVCGTEDVHNGGDRYAWYGIGPHVGYPGSDCIKNAENWAFFAADCGSLLTADNLNWALKII